MSNQWNKEECTQLKKTLESDGGKLILDRLEELKQFWLEKTMVQSNRDDRLDCIALATGVQFVIGDLNTLAEKANEKEEKAAK